MKLHPYPEHQGCETGCKVSWFFYEDREQAELAAEAARRNAITLEGRGFDFGFQSPGQITEPERSKRPGLFQVVIP